MKIAVITDFLDLNPSGIGVYINSLLERLLELDRENEYLLIHLKESENPLYSKAREMVIPMPKTPPRNTLRKNLLIPKLLKEENIDLLHEPSQITPILVKTPCKRILNAHDVIPLVCHKGNVFTTAYYRWIMSKACGNADRIIAPSHYSKNDITLHLGVREQKISVLYNPLGEEWMPKPNKDMVLAKYGLEKYVLYVGGYDPRKNLPPLLRSFNKLLQSHPGLKLALVGGKTHDYFHVKNTIERIGLSGSVVLIEPPSKEELMALYTSASVFVLPSLYEGFGYTPLEAMSCGAPVVASNTTSLPEVIGDAGLLVDARSPDALAEAISQVLSDDNLRKRLVERGFERVKVFNPNAIARQTLELYKEVTGDEYHPKSR